MPDPTKRFSDRVENYIKYRPEYPQEIITKLRTTIGLSPDWKIADIGSGTGKSTAPFLKNGNTCYAIEPNEPMRLAAENELKTFPNFHSSDGTAETTGLPSQSIDLVLAGQAFHWFDIAAAKREFQRILQAEGYALLLWNKRKDDGSPFMKAYNEFLLEYSTDYQKVNLRRVDHAVYRNFFREEQYQEIQIPYQQIFNLEGLIGRYLSCSYAFAEGHLKHQEAMEVLTGLFGKYEEKGMLGFHYETGLYFGKM